MAFTRLTLPASYSDTTQYPTGPRGWRTLLQIMPDAIKTYLNNSLAPWMDNLERFTTKSGFNARASANQPINAITPTKLNYATETYDYNTEYDTTTSTFTVKVAGLYRVEGGVGWQSPQATNRSYIEVWINGVAVRRINDGIGTWGNIGGADVPLNVNDAVTLRAYTVNALTTDGATNSYANYFTVTKIG